MTERALIAMSGLGADDEEKRHTMSQNLRLPRGKFGFYEPTGPGPTCPLGSRDWIPSLFRSDLLIEDLFRID